MFSAVNREIRRIVRRKLRRHPIGISGMTGSAIRAETRLHVIGTLGRLEIGLVT